MTIRLTSDEAWEAVGAAHTGILTTLRRDGMPIALPVWFVVDDRSIALMTPAGTKKIARIRHDPRASFLVESGEQYTELRGIHLTGRVELVEDAATISLIEARSMPSTRHFDRPLPACPRRLRRTTRARCFCASCPMTES
jgi:nitroimidazol reductase NimA-like FMN-containing flavoprotein (pyridoxamine 5'-phosphate oxidase superfamily)